MIMTTCTPTLALRPYQLEAIQSIETARDAGKYAALLVLPTGTGKTLCFGSLVQHWNTKTLIIAHREELLAQAKDKLKMIWPTADVGIVGAGYEEMGHQITVASVQSASRPKRLQQLAAAGIRLVIVDEAHHAPAASYLRILEVLKAGKPGGNCFLVGVTATPLRKDQLSLATLFGPPSYVMTLPSAIADHWLCDLRGIRIRTQTRLDDVHIRRGDFDQSELDRAVNTDLRNGQILEAWQKHAADRPTIIFAASVQHAYDLADTFRSADVTAAALDGETPREERRQLLADFAHGDIQVICNMGVLTEGFDQPEVSCIVLGRPTQSQGLYIQEVGRGSRLAPGKKDCLVLDIVDVSRKHQLVQLPDLVGGRYPNRPVVLSPRSHAPEREEEGQPFSLHDAVTGPTMLHSEDVKLIRVWEWERVGASYRLQIGDNPYGKHLWLRPDQTDSTRYKVLHIAGAKSEYLSPQSLPLGWAQSVAEAAADHLEKGNIQLVDRSAPWRSAPASEKQLTLLRKMRIPIAPGLTKGVASDLLAVAFARQKGA